jgi:hypothetical protein
MSTREFSDSYYTKADEAKAFADYAPFRYGKVEPDLAQQARVRRLRVGLDPILVDIVDGGIEAAVMEAEAAVERTARSTIIREQHDYRASLNTVDCLSVSRVSWAATADPIRMNFRSSASGRATYTSTTTSIRRPAPSGTCRTTAW